MAVDSMHADIGASIEKRATGVQASGFLGKSDGTLEDVALIALLAHDHLVSLSAGTRIT